MCGIAGYVALPGRGRPEAAANVLRSLEHRGPDDFGWLALTGKNVNSGRIYQQPPTRPEALLLHRRLSILDVSESGWQPMSSRDGRYHIVYNGEIYNYIELRQELENLGHRFGSASDTEVLLAALAEWGQGALRRLVGMFAFALLDTKSRTIQLARDFFGIKPLFYMEDEGCVYFASEIKALREFGLSHPRVDAERLLLYLRFGIADFGQGTMLSRVRQVPPAHYITISLDTCQPDAPQCYWRLDTGGTIDLSFNEAAAQLREIFLRSVQIHLRSDVPVGLALSGGIDSSSILGAIRHLDSKAVIHAFSFIAEDAAISEERWVDIASAYARAQVHKVRATADELAQDLGAMMQYHDEPFGSTSAYAQFRVFRAAHHAGVKVMLDGQGADEILAGYDQYKGARLASLIRQGKWTALLSFLRNVSSNGGIGSFTAIAYCADFLLPPALQSFAREIVGKDTFPAWLHRRWFEQRGAGAAFGNDSHRREVLRDSLTRSVRRTLPGLLRNEDRNSMAWSVESRVPFLTPDLYQFLHLLPESYLIDEHGVSKSVFRRAMRGIVPDQILDRNDKVGFATPEKWWLTQLEDWVRSSLDGGIAHELPFFDVNAAQHELDAVRRGTRPFGFHIWRWINLIHWTEKLGAVYE